MKTFAAINVGSYEQTLKIYTITKNSGIREVDWIRNRLDLGGTFATGKLSHEVMDELCAYHAAYRSLSGCAEELGTAFPRL